MLKLAVRASQIQGELADSQVKFACRKFQYGALWAWWQAFQLARDLSIGGKAKRLGFAGKTGDSLTHPRVLPRRASIALDLLGKRDQFLHQSDHVGALADPHALEHQRSDRHLPSLVLLADKVFLRHSYVLEKDFIKASCSGHLNQRSHGDARAVHVNQQVAQTLMLWGMGVGANKQDTHVGAVCLGGPDLLSVHDEVIAIFDCPGLQR